MSSFGRRRFAFLLIALGSLGIAGCPGGTKPPEETPPGNPPPETPVAVHDRVEISSLSADQVAALRAGVALMQKRATTDPTSWAYQANIHGVPAAGDNCPAETTPMQEAWATCQHGSFFFLAWHRIYLYYFESILRAAVREAKGDPNYDFALPYWDYANGSPQLPALFTTPADSTNSLYVSERRPSCNTAIAGQDCVTVQQGSSIDAMDTIPTCNCPAGEASCDGCTAGLLPDQTFFGQFTPQPEHFLGQFGELELQPHNVIHNRVGSATGWMSDPNCAARDPVFWNHHANIDRLWQRWLNQNADRLNPIGSTAWTTQTFTFFDEKGQKVTKTGCDILNMVTQLDYQYVEAGVPLEIKNVVLCSGTATATPPSVAPATQPTAIKTTMLAASPEKGTVLGRDAVTVSVPLPAAKSERIKSLVADTKPEKVRLVFEGLELLGKGGVYEVYIDLPAGQKPDPAGPYFVGNISLFGHVGHGGKVSRSFDLSDEVRELDQKGEWKGDAKVTIVPADGKEAGASVLRFLRASLVVPGE